MRYLKWHGLSPWVIGNDNYDSDEDIDVDFGDGGDECRYKCNIT